MTTDDSVMRSIVLPVPPEQAWDALTRPSELAEWLADEVESEGPLEEGSEALLRWDDGQEWGGGARRSGAGTRGGSGWRGSTPPTSPAGWSSPGGRTAPTTRPPSSSRW